MVRVCLLSFGRHVPWLIWNPTVANLAGSSVGLILIFNWMQTPYCRSLTMILNFSLCHRRVTTCFMSATALRQIRFWWQWQSISINAWDKRQPRLLFATRILLRSNPMAILKKTRSRSDGREHDWPQPNHLVCGFKQDSKWSLLIPIGESASANGWNSVSELSRWDKAHRYPNDHVSWLIGGNCLPRKPKSQICICSVESLERIIFFMRPPKSFFKAGQDLTGARGVVNVMDAFSRTRSI